MPTKKYAAGTKVSTEKSVQDIKKLLKKHGATEFATIEREDALGFAFELYNDKGTRRRIRFVVQLPTIDSFMSYRSGRGMEQRTEAQAQAQHEQEMKRVYRAILNTIKSKLITIEEGIATIEDEFLPYTVLADGSTFADWAKGQVDAIAAGKMPPLLPPG